MTELMSSRFVRCRRDGVWVLWVEICFGMELANIRNPWNQKYPYAVDSNITYSVHTIFVYIYLCL